MSIKAFRWVFVLLCSSLMPLYAQQTATSANETMSTNPNVTKAPKGPKLTKKSEQTTVTTTTTTTTTKQKTTTPVYHSAHHHGKARVFADSTRIAAILEDTQGKATIDAPAWKRIANEANALANRIYADTTGNTTAHKAARELRTHVREMRTSALKGDADGAKSHAALALPFAYQLIDWSAPAA